MKKIIKETEIKKTYLRADNIVVQEYSETYTEQYSGNLLKIYEHLKKNNTGGLFLIPVNSGIKNNRLILEFEKYNFDLKYFVESSKYLKEHISRINLIIRICSIIKKLHNNNIIHRDLKLSNFIFNSKINEFSLSDFDFAIDTEKCPDFIPVAGTSYYLAPETMLNSKLDFRNDIYSLGIIFIEILLKLQLNSSITDDFIEKIDFDKNDELKNIIRRCVNPDPALRYSDVEEISSDILKSEIYHNCKIEENLKDEIIEIKKIGMPD